MSQYGNIKSNKTDFERVGLPDKKIGGSLGDEANDSMNDVIQPPHLLRPKPTRYVSYLCKFVYCMAAVNAAPYDPQRLTRPTQHLNGDCLFTLSVPSVFK